ncbi:protein kinase activating protein dpb11 [Basidiobolus ranarum]|uniref:Protein kinase activating protein dpb11 n=1 Tax=Basidiobolus ranarum TaxID=34480 RepID=A0ABR2WVV7_9FUNG
MSRLRPNVKHNTILYDDDSFMQRKPFEDYVICCTGLSSGIKQTLYSQVEELGGRIQPDFTAEVTHLIADKVGSEKYKAAIRCQIPILTPSWTEQCYQYFKNSEDFEPNAISKLHVLSPLAGCCICVTGLSGDEREAVEKMTIENGGEYSAALTMPCTHLIVKAPEGRKFQAAVKRNLHIVNPDWLYECIKQKACVNEVLYPAVANPDSMAAGSTLRRSGTLTQDRQRLLRENKDSTMYLDGCNIYFGDGFGPEKMMLMKKIIVDGGGSRHSDFIACITHFVASNSTLTEKDKDLLRHTTNKPIIVHSKWLQDCYRDCTLHPTNQYSIEFLEGEFARNDFHGIDENGKLRGQFQGNPKTITETKESDQRATVRKNPAVTGGNSMVKSKNFWEDLAEDMKEEIYPTAKNASSHLLHRSRSTMSVAEVKASEKTPLEKRTRSLTPHCPSQEASLGLELAYTTRSKELDNGSDVAKQSTKSGIFSEYFFFCQNFPVDQKQIVEKVVLDNGGSFYSEAPHSLTAPVDKYFRIVPLKSQQSATANMRFKTATECWLESCIDEQRLIPLEEKVIYSPLKTQFPIKEFRNYYIGITGYTELEREHIGRLCITLGATFSERFSKKYTHLICKQKSGVKYRRAVEWGIPVVDSDWIFDIAKNGIKPDHQNLISNEIEGRNEVTFEEKCESKSIGKLLEQNNGDRHSERTISGKLQNRFPTPQATNGATVTPTTKKYEASIASKITVDTPHHNTFLGKKDFRPQFDTTGILSSLKSPEGCHTPTNGAAYRTPNGPASAMTPSLTSANPQFDTTAALNALMSPGTAPNTISKSAVTPFFQRVRGNVTSSTPGVDAGSPLDSTFSRKLSLALEQMESTDSVHDSGQALFTNTADISNMDSTTFFGETDQNHHELNNITSLLQGVTIYVSQRLAHRRNELCDIARELGAQCAWIFDESCTHLIHQGSKVAENFKDFKLAKQKGKMIVSPLWLQKCKELRARVDERDYPHTYVPNKSHLVTSNFDYSFQKGSQGSDQDSVLATQAGFRKHVSITSVEMSLLDAKQSSDDEFLKPETLTTDRFLRESATKKPLSTTKKQTPDPPKVNYAAAVDELIGRVSTDRKRRRARSSFGMLRSNTDQASDQDGSKQDVSISDISAISGKTVSLFDTSADILMTEAHSPEPPHIAEINSTQEPAPVMYDDPEGRREKRKLLDRLLMNKRLRISPNDGSESENDSSDTSSIKPKANVIDLDESEDSVQEPNPPVKFTKQTSTKSERTISDISAPTEQKTSSNKVSSALPKLLDLQRFPTSIMNEMIQDEANMNEEPDPTPSRRSTRISAQTSFDKRQPPKQRISPKFLLSSMTGEFKNRLIKTIRRLGGVIFNTDQWTSECTHLIVGYPSRSEKFLAACASGAWVLKPSFVDSSVLTDEFVNEEEHEWTAENDMKPEDKLLVGAAKRWRLKLQELQAVNAEVKGSFTGWNVLLIVETKKREGFVRLLQAGNAEVNVARPPFRNVATENLTHVFVEPNKVRTLPNHFVHSMLEARVPCLETDFIVEFLTKDEDSDQNQFWIKHPALQKKRKV